MKGKDVIKIFAWDILNPLILSAKKKKVYNIGENIHGVNIGCGIDNPSDWMGLDGGITHLFVGKTPRPISKMFFRMFSMSKNYSFEEYFSKAKATQFIHHEITHGLPFKDNSVPNVFSSHFLEHLFKKDAAFVIREAFRVMKPGGVIRITGSDFDNEIKKLKQAISEYESGNWEPIQLYVTTNIVGYNSKYSNRRNMYNVEGFKKLLQDAGFVDITERNFGEGKIIDVEKLDTRKGIFLEATKPLSQKADYKKS